MPGNLDVQGPRPLAWESEQSPRLPSDLRSIDYRWFSQDFYRCQEIWMFKVPGLPRRSPSIAPDPPEILEYMHFY